MMLVVQLKLHVDETRDDAEWFPEIVTFGAEHWPHGKGLFTGQSKASAAAWDLCEALYGNPAPHKQYRIDVEPINE